MAERDHHYAARPVRGYGAERHPARLLTGARVGLDVLLDVIQATKSPAA